MMMILLMFLMHVRIQLLANFIDLWIFAQRKSFMCALSSIHELLIRKVHDNGLMREFWCC